MLCILLVLLDAAPFNKMSRSALPNERVLMKLSPYNMHKATKKKIKENWGKKKKKEYVVAKGTTK